MCEWRAAEDRGRHKRGELPAGKFALDRQVALDTTLGLVSQVYAKGLQHHTFVMTLRGDLLRLKL